jgi:hypothetical protein
MPARKAGIVGSRCARQFPEHAALPSQRHSQRPPTDDAERSNKTPILKGNGTCLETDPKPPYLTYDNIPIMSALNADCFAGACGNNRQKRFRGGSEPFRNGRGFRRWTPFMCQVDPSVPLPQRMKKRKGGGSSGLVAISAISTPTNGCQSSAYLHFNDELVASFRS